MFFFLGISKRTGQATAHIQAIVFPVIFSKENQEGKSSINLNNRTWY